MERRKEGRKEGRRAGRGGGRREVRYSDTVLYYRERGVCV